MLADFAYVFFGLGAAILAVSIVVLAAALRTGLPETLARFSRPLMVAAATRNTIACIPVAVETMTVELRASSQACEMYIPVSFATLRFGTMLHFAVAAVFTGALLGHEFGAGDVALVFGTEKHGLSNEDLRRCHQLVTIPGEPGACLNLAQAATILAYVWRRAAGAPGLAPTALATEAGIDDLAGRLGALLEARKLIKPNERASKLHTLRRILSRASLSPDEAALVTGWLRALAPRSDHDA